MREVLKTVITLLPGPLLKPKYEVLNFLIHYGNCLPYMQNYDNTGSQFAEKE